MKFVGSLCRARQGAGVGFFLSNNGVSPLPNSVKREYTHV